MAGHSKWANIKHRKGKADAKKGKVFSRIAKEIITAVKESGPDPKSNPRLRLAMQKAKAANMPNDNVDRNIAKASSADQQNYDEVSYEIYGHGGVGIIVEGMTDNKNRLASDLRIATNKRGGTIASPGSVAFNFDRKGIIQIDKTQGAEDDLFEMVINCGAEDFEACDDIYVVTTDPAELYNVKEALEENNIECSDSNLEMVPKVFVECTEDVRKSNEALLEWLEDTDDVDNVYHNMEE